MSHESSSSFPERQRDRDDNVNVEDEGNDAATPNGALGGVLSEGESDENQAQCDIAEMPSHAFVSGSHNEPQFLAGSIAARMAGIHDAITVLTENTSTRSASTWPTTAEGEGGAEHGAASLLAVGAASLAALKEDNEHDPESLLAAIETQSAKYMLLRIPIGENEDVKDDLLFKGQLRDCPPDDSNIPTRMTWSSTRAVRPPARVSNDEHDEHNEEAHAHVALEQQQPPQPQQAFVFADARILSVDTEGTDGSLHGRHDDNALPVQHIPPSTAFIVLDSDVNSSRHGLSEPAAAGATSTDGTSNNLLSPTTTTELPSTTITSSVSDKTSPSTTNRTNRRRMVVVGIVVAAVVLVVSAVCAAIFAVLCSSGDCFSRGSTRNSDPSVATTTTTTAATNDTLASTPSSAPSVVAWSNMTDMGNTSNPYTADMVEFINNITLTGRVLFPPLGTATSTTTSSTAASSPEELALAWIVQQDPMRLGVISASMRFRVIQRYALRTLWVQWNISDPFFVGDECQWYGVTCQSELIDGDGEEDAVGLQNVVTEISFFENDLSGRLSPDLGLLSHLVKVNLFDNSFDGSLPETIGLWSQLEYFSIAFNAFTGTIPSSIGQWSAIREVYFGANALSGTLPESIGQWHDIQKVHLNYISLTGTIPTAVGNWTNVTFVSLIGNALNGTLPESIGQWSSIEYFYATDNELTGVLPSSIANWTRLDMASFSSNDFTGSLPLGVCQFNATLDADCESEILCPCCTTCL